MQLSCAAAAAAAARVQSIVTFFTMVGSGLGLPASPSLDNPDHADHAASSTAPPSVPRFGVGILTAGGHAPCLAAAVAALIERYYETGDDVDMYCYRQGYAGLLTDDFIRVTKAIVRNLDVIYEWGGSPIGNSRVKLTNAADCVKRGLVLPGQDPQYVAAEHLKKRGIRVLHTIGGDDTSLAAAALAEFLQKNGYALRVIGLPKTIDNDIFPIARTLGAYTAGEEAARFFDRVVTECGASRRMLIVHEVMGRASGFLTAHAARCYRDLLGRRSFLPEIGIIREKYDIHGVYLPEDSVNLAEDAKRLTVVMNTYRNVNIFVSEGACLNTVVASLKEKGQDPPRDAFGHIALDRINVGRWFGSTFAKMIGADKVLVQKSGYYARSAKANVSDLWMIKGVADKAVEVALSGVGQGVIGHDEENGRRLRAIEFSRIRGGKPFDMTRPWYVELQELTQRYGSGSPHDPCTMGDAESAGGRAGSIMPSTH